MAARTLLLKLERAGHIRLPKRRRKSTNGLRNRNAPLMAHATAPIKRRRFQLNCLLSRFTTWAIAGGREHPGIWCATVGLQPVRLSLEVRGARRMDRMGSRHAGGEPGVVETTRFLFALGRGAALGQPPARVSRSTYSRRLAEQVPLETFVDRSRFRGTC